MRTICLAASKGGVGKTTLAAALAIAGVGDGARVALIDADPQQSLAGWYGARDKTDNPVLIGEPRQAVMARHKAATGGDFGVCLIDTPPAMISIIEPCVRLAQLVIIPCRVSPLDVMAIDPIVELCGEYDVPLVFVLNQTTPRSGFTEVIAAELRKHGPILEAHVLSRQSYAVAMVRGLTAPEIERGDGARDEIAALWKAIKRRVARSK